MYSTSHILKEFEICPRKSFWMKTWERDQIDAKELLYEGIKSGLTTSRKDFGDAAGEEIISVARDQELIQDDKADQYSSIIHLASLSDIIVSAIRKPTDDPWTLPEPVDLGDGVTWHSSCFLAPSGQTLRRVSLVSSWSKDRHFGDQRGWNCLGESCVYGLPMQTVVIVLGQHREGKYNGYWSKGFRHPINRGLRIKRKNFISKGFSDSWTQCWREDYDQISTQEWLDQMIKDEVLQDVCFRVDLPLPDEENRQRIVDLAKSKLKRIYSTDELPEQNLSVCDFPIPCAAASS